MLLVKTTKVPVTLRAVKSGQFNGDIQDIQVIFRQYCSQLGLKAGQSNRKKSCSIPATWLQVWKSSSAAAGFPLWATASSWRVGAA